MKRQSHVKMLISEFVCRRGGTDHKPEGRVPSVVWVSLAQTGINAMLLQRVRHVPQDGFVRIFCFGR